MPLNGDSRRIYPEPAPPHIQSTAYHKPGRFDHQAAGNDARTAKAAQNLVSNQHKPSSMPLFNQGMDLDGPSDRNNRSGMTTSQPGPVRSRSQSRKPNTTMSTRIKSEPADAAVDRAALAAGMKMAVPNTLPTQRAPPMKHQTSQSTVSSVQERGWEQTGNQRNRHMGAREQNPFGSGRRDIADELDDDSSITFDRDRYDDYGEDYQGPPAEPTALFRGAPVNTSIPSDFVSNITSEDIAAARQWGSNRTMFDPTPAQFDRATGPSINDDDDLDMGSSFNDETTQMFNEEDRADLMRQQRRLDERTPSKPPGAALPATKRSGQATVKQVIVQSPAQHWGRDRSSSPLPDDPLNVDQKTGKEKLKAYQKNGIEHLHNFRQDLATTEHPKASSSAGLASASKVAESQETSEDERPTAQAGQDPRTKKRSFAQIDYDPDKLERMTYADLDAVPFLTDPRAPPPETTMDANGTPITLEQRLANLSRMNQEEQKSLFRSLTDAQNEDVGQWFMQKFGEDLKRLMNTRLERRKVALTYEMESRKRQREVEVKTADLTSELDDLRKGGSQLVEGRGSPRPPR